MTAKMCGGEATKDARRIGTMEGPVFSALEKLSATLTQVRDVESLVSCLDEAVRQLLDCTDTGLWLADDEQRTLELYQAESEALHDGNRVRVAYGQGVAGMVAESRRPVIVTDVVQQGIQDPMFACSGACAALAVPLIWREQLLGVLVAADERSQGSFAAPELRLSEMIARQVTLVLANNRLMVENETSRSALIEEQERLLYVQVAVRQMLDQPDTKVNLNEVLQALQALGWRQVMLVLYSEQMAPEMLAAVGVPPEEEMVLADSLIPGPFWQRFLQGDLESYRVGGLYYVPVDESSPVWQDGDLLFAPLRLGQEKVAGVVRLRDPVNRSRPTPVALRLLDILTSQMAYIVENARLLQEMSRSAEDLAEQVEELSMIHRADRELSAHLSMDRVMTLTMDWALRRTGASGGLLTLMTEDKRGMVPFIMMGYVNRDIMSSTEQNPWQPGEGAVREAVQTGQVQIRRGQSSSEFETVGEEHVQIAVPLSMRGEVLGMIVLESDDPKAFGEHDVSFLVRLARRAAVALDNARLYRQSEQLADDMAVLYTASRAITSTLDRDRVLQQIAQSLAVALECSSAMILDFQADMQTAQVLVVYKVGTVRGADERLPEAGSVISMASYPTMLASVGQHHSLALRTSDSGLTAEEREFLEVHRIQSLMLVPLVAQAELIGVAFVIEGRPSRDRVFRSNEIFKAETLASQASVALRQSLLYSEVLELERVKSEMIRMASHDLRNPLNTITGYIELLRMSMMAYGATPDQDEYLTHLSRSAEMMRSLIDDLLTLERAESQHENEWQVFDLEGLVIEVVEAEQSNASLKGQTLRLACVGEGLEVFGSLTQLRQAVTNYVSNAIKYTPEGGHIAVRLECENGRALLIVEDDGYGISLERQSRVFERFYRAREPATAHIPGTGLGLSLVKTVIERHGGSVWFESVLGQGSTFGLWLPLADRRPLG